MSIRYRLTAATTFLIVILTLVFTSIAYVREKQTLIRELDQKLHLAAELAAETLPPNYHDRIDNKDSVSPQEYAEVVHKNDNLCRTFRLQYLWSVLSIDGRIVHTSATTPPSREINKGQYAPFFSAQEPEGLASAFKKMEAVYTTFHNQWGDGRMILLPSIDHRGRPYCIGASIGFDEINKALKKNIIHALALCGWMLAGGVAGSIALSIRLTRSIRRLTKAANSIAQGEMNQVIKTGGSAELKSLGKSIEVMRNAINKTISELKSEITERQFVEEKLREAEAHYRVLFLESPDGILIINPVTGIPVEFNESARLQLGYSRREFAQLSLFDYQVDQEGTRARIERVLKTGKDDFDTKMRTRSGEIRHVHFTAQIISMSQHPAFHCIWRDITERKRAKERLLIEQKNLKAIFSATPVGMLLMDEDATIVEANGMLKSLISKNLVQLIHQRSRTDLPQIHESEGCDLALAGLECAFRKKVLPLLSSGKPVHDVEMQVELVANGQEHHPWLKVSAEPVSLDTRGHVIVAVDDITERKSNEAALRRANRALLILKKCDEALVHTRTEPELLNSICRILANVWGAQMTWVGYAEHDERKTVRVVTGSDESYTQHLNVTWADDFHGHGPVGTAIRTRKAYLCRDIPNHPSFASSRHDALKRGFASMIALPLLNENDCLGALAIYSSQVDAFNKEEVELLEQLASDLTFGIISLRKQAETEQLQKELLHVSEHAKQLIAQELHDGLCQNLAGTAFMTSLLQSKLKAKKDSDTELAKEIGRLLSVSVNEARNLAHGLHPIGPEGEGLMNALSQLAETVCNLFHIQCSFECPDPVFLPNESISTHLFRITQEAINNARKHGEADNIIIALQKTPEALTLTIRDNGIGIPAKISQKTGMGLRIMHHRASQIKASLTVRKAGRTGTVVACTVPISTQDGSSSEG